MDNSESFYDDEDRTVSDMLLKFESRLRCKFQDFERIWEDLGIVGEERLEHCGAAINHLSGLLSEMVGEAQADLKKKKKEVEDFKCKLMSLYRELGETAVELDLKGGVKRQREILLSRVSALEERKQRVMARYSALMKEYSDLCSVLRHYQQTYLDDIVPSEEQLRLLENDVQKLRVTKAERSNQYYEIKKEIMTMIVELEVEPSNDFEEMVVYEEIDMFVLSTSNMDSLKMYHEQLSKTLRKTRAEADELRSNIQRMWESIPAHERGEEDFLDRYSDCRTATINKLKEELERCRRVRRANLSRLIHESRIEIRKWWVQCYYASEQCDEFTAYKSCDLTEELLEAHDKELDRLKRFHKDHESLFNNIDRRAELFQRYVELEKNATDPNRFSNRGGQLLKEEKERKQLEKELPLVERSIEMEISNWELATGRQFLVGGEPFRDYVKHQRQEYERKKQAEKDFRKCIKQQSQKQDSLCGSRVAMKTKRRPPVTPGGAQAVMLTLLAPPSDSGPTNSKRGRVDDSRSQVQNSALRDQAAPNLSKIHQNKTNNKSLTMRGRNLRRSQRLKAAAYLLPTGVNVGPSAKRTGIPIPAPSSRLPTFGAGIGGGVVMERDAGGGAHVRTLRQVNRFLDHRPLIVSSLDQDGTLCSDATPMVGSRPLNAAAVLDSGIDCSLASVGQYQDFALPMRTFLHGDAVDRHQSSMLPPPTR